MPVPILPKSPTNPGHPLPDDTNPDQPIPETDPPDPPPTKPPTGH